MNDSEYQRLREAAWKRTAKPDEAARLDALLGSHPQARAEWEVEAQLNRALDGLRPPELASNFTAQIVQAAAAMDRTRRHRRGPLGMRWLRPSAFFPRLAFGLAAVAICAIGIQQYHAWDRKTLARAIAQSSVNPPLANWELLRDFDAINQLHQAPALDVDLMAALD